MNFGLWLSENRQRMLKILTGFLLAVCAFFFIYSTYNYIIYFLSEDPLASLGATPTSPRQLTAPLQVSAPQIFSSGDKSDLAVKLVNPNEKFLATFHYCFTQAGADFLCGEDFILPGDQKYVLVLGQTVSGSQSETAFRLTDVFWKRLDAHAIPSWADFAASRRNFSVSDLIFTSARANASGLNSLSFTIFNPTPYSYYELPLNLLFFNGENLAGVNRYILANFLSGESREVRLTWSGNLGSANRAEVAPDVNILSDSVYRRYEAGN